MSLRELFGGVAKQEISAEVAKESYNKARQNEINALFQYKKEKIETQRTMEQVILCDIIIDEELEDEE